VAFSPCGKRLATGGERGAVIVTDLETGEAEYRLQGAVIGGASLSFSADGAQLASGNDDGSIAIWAEPTGKLLRSFADLHEEWVHEQVMVASVSFSPTTNRILVSASRRIHQNYEDISIKFWDVDKGEMIWSTGGSEVAAFSPGGGTIVIDGGRGGHDLQLVDAQSGALRLRMESHAGLYSAAFCGNEGSKLASGGRDGNCKVHP
jgi:WD40 repeat protein